MLSVAKLTLGQEAYYEQQVAQGVDDYYAGRGESPGIWAGSGSQALGLVGVVEDGQLGTLLRGVDPSTDERIRTAVRERTITVRELDLRTGEWRDGRKTLAPVAGYDLVFSCPKSVSILHALTDDESVRREISQAHEASWQAALAYLEREACVVRRGHGGAIRERGGGFVAAAFRHRTSRAQDPHLHTHVVVANMAQGEDGEWRALDGEAILKTYRLAAGYLYEAQLRDELSARLGVQWTEPVKGMAELAHVPEEAVRAFSTRRESLVEHMEALGTHGFAAARVAALATRETKEQIELPHLREQWLARAGEHGLGRNELRELVGPPYAPAALDLRTLSERLFHRDGLTAQQTTFTLPELVCAVAGAVPQGAPVTGVLDAAARLTQLPALELVEPQEAPGRPARFTTSELLELEYSVLELALGGRDVGAPRTAPGRIVTQQGLHLSEEQRTLVREATMSSDRVVCVIGAAGAGKTTALRAVNAVFVDAGIPVLGAAPSGRAAEELGSATGMRSSTMHRLLLDAQRNGGLPERCVLVVDEAGMAETRVLAPLLRLVDEARGKAILVGDPQQLPAVGAGGLYAALCERLGSTDLTQNRRQHDVGEKIALARLRSRNAEPYLAHAAARGRLHVVDDPLLAKQRLLEDWWHRASRDLDKIMIAHRRNDVRELNDAARALMLRERRLGNDALTLGDREFRVGDRILCRHNDPVLGVRNGTRGTVVELDMQSQSLTMRADAGSVHRLPADYSRERLEHGYALTGHAAQGATVDRAFVLFRDAGALQEWGYVALSRARHETRLYLAGEALEREAHGRTPQQPEPAARLARALEQPRSELLALEQIHERRKQAHDTLRRAEQRLEAARAELRDAGWLQRRRHAPKLQRELAAAAEALERARQDAQDVARETRAHKRSRPGVARAVTRKRELGLELY